MTTQDLVDAGFKKFPPGIWKNSDEAYQKRYRGRDGKTKYFLEVFFWDKRQYQGTDQWTHGGFQAECNLYPHEDGHWFTVQIHSFSDKSVKWLEETVETIYLSGCFALDRHNND